ncbi:helix-turn-helix transcriptional regulator [Pseudenhygromyxa sp. WMMC2535]|uniref:helix-turn-helix domain-containing protein n=1 Tax=Pseudenhygromyxa sp. WMMC2535 TaxID=2712867 RepID=UPI001552F947|nr:AraC family transcriptional regulator [Pseudenhygromyxa sp. WMMC2535]NVB40962.1 helix-turn-helix transcriptional regulator [Pseudenhygromyxa sp. WMMC2535]
MDASAPQLVSVDELVRSTANYSAWLEGPPATGSQVGVHGFQFDAHDQHDAVILDVFHVLVCMRGEAAVSRMVGDALESIHLGPGEVLVNPSATSLRWQWSGAVDVLNITVHPRYLDDLAREAMGCPVRLRADVPHHRPDPALARFGLDLHQELDTPRLGAHRAARAIGERIALHLLRNYVCVDRLINARSFSEAEQRRLLEFIDGRLGEPIGVATLASLVEMGKHHFSRTFRATFGASPSAWLRERRLERARSLLMKTSASIASIAAQSGFADQSHLTRWFARHYGITPAALRRRR